MFPFSREVRIFVSACEELQSLPMHGGTLTPDEKDVVEFFAKNLLSAHQRAVRGAKRLDAGLRFPYWQRRDTSPQREAYYLEG